MTGGFGRIPAAAIDAGVVATLSGSEVKVWVALLRHADMEWKAFPGLTRISELSGLHRRTVERALASMVRKGIVKVIGAGVGRGCRTVYKVLDNPVKPGEATGFCGTENPANPSRKPGEVTGFCETENPANPSIKPGEPVHKTRSTGTKKPGGAVAHRTDHRTDQEQTKQQQHPCPRRKPGESTGFPAAAAEQYSQSPAGDAATATPTVTLAESDPATDPSGTATTTDRAATDPTTGPTDLAATDPTVDSAASNRAAEPAAIDPITGPTDPVAEALIVARIAEPKRSAIAGEFAGIPDAAAKITKIAAELRTRGKGTGAIVLELEALAVAERRRIDSEGHRRRARSAWAEQDAEHRRQLERERAETQKILDSMSDDELARWRDRVIPTLPGCLRTACRNANPRTDGALRAAIIGMVRDDRRAVAV